MRLSRAEQRNRGRELRSRLPRSAHTKWSVESDRPDPVLILRANDEGKIPDLLDIRYERMSTSPLTFLRGAAAVMAFDLGTSPSTGIRTQLLGDAHLENFGLFATPERRLVFDVNDFDETLPGPFEWDVKRMATSFYVAGREFGLSEGACADAASASVCAYRRAMMRLQEMSTLDVWYWQLEIEDAVRVLGSKRRARAQKVVDKARSSDHVGALDKLTEAGDEGRRLVENPPFLQHREEVSDEVTERALRAYRRSLSPERRVLFDRYHLVDVALKGVGVGSLGTRCFVMYLEAVPDEGHDPLFMQIKEAGRSALEPYAGKNKLGSHGRRVVVGQRLMQAAGDIFLGWIRDASGDFYFRQLQDMKGGVEPERFRPKEWPAYARICGLALARAHGRAGDPALISGYLGRGDHFDRAVSVFARSYADQNERDREALSRSAHRTAARLIASA